MGFLGGNLGIAMGAGVDEYNKQRQLAIAEKGEKRAEAADLRSQQMHDQQMAELRRQAETRDRAQKVWSEMSPLLQKSPAERAKYLAGAYNANDGAIEGYNDGNNVDVQEHANGVYVSPKNADGSFGQTKFYSHDDVNREFARAIHNRLASVGPEYGQQFLNWMDADRKETREGKRWDAYERRLDSQTELQKQQNEMQLKKLEEQLRISKANLALAQNEGARRAQDQAFENTLRAPLMNEMKGYQLGATAAGKAGLADAKALYEQAQADAVRRYKDANSHRDNNRYFAFQDKSTDELGNEIVKTRILDRQTNQISDPPVANKPGASALPKTREEADQYWDAYKSKFNGDKNAYYKKLGL